MISVTAPFAERSSHGAERQLCCHGKLVLGGGESAVEAKLQPNDLLRKSLLFGEAEKAASPPQKRCAERTAAGLHRENYPSTKEAPVQTKITDC